MLAGGGIDSVRYMAVKQDMVAVKSSEAGYVWLWAFQTKSESKKNNFNRITPHKAYFGLRKRVESKG